MNTEAHRQKMAAKKAARATMQPGYFQPRMSIGKSKSGLMPMTGHWIARSTVFRPTKNDSPAYRKQVAAPVVAEKPKRVRKPRAKKAAVS